MFNISQQIAQELNVKSVQIDAAISLLDEGATVPFIARYRKEATQGLDDNHLRHLEQRLQYLRELHARKALVLKNISAQDALTPALKSQIEQIDNKTELEDLYLPYRPKRRTKGQIAIEAGLEPLANSLYDNWHLDPEQEASKYLNDSITDTKAALDGAAFILMERFAQNAPLLQKLRKYMQQNAHLTSQVIATKAAQGNKFKDYFDYSEAYKQVPSHRALALFRGRNEGILQLSLNPDPSQDKQSESSCEQMIRDHFGLRLTQQPVATWLNRVVKLTWRVKLALSLETELLGSLREQAETEAINVFANNLKDLLMAAPAGPKVTLGIDPGIRTGCKIAIVDATSKLLYTTTIYPHEPQNHWEKSKRTLSNLINQYKVELIAIGNGTGSRETDKMVGEAFATLSNTKPRKIIVSEAGASIYSASEFAAKEFPELDVSLRGAVSIARRLQDPLAELVKIEAKAIGVGQYQHDVSQSKLSLALDAVIEDCVNAVGVDLNSASVPLLQRVSGLTKTMAQNIVQYRDQNGAFNARSQLMDIPRLGAKAFEQAAGFLRIRDGQNPLDYTGVHPESYPVVKDILAQNHLSLADLIGQADVIKTLDPSAYIRDQFGLPTIKDILAELEKPGRDPRPEFKTATYREGVNSVADLEQNMILEGVVSNVTNFGAFVDIGVHQDGLVHISSLTDKFVSNPHDIVKAGDIVKVKVLDVEQNRNRITLTMRLDEKPSSGSKPAGKQPSKPHSSNKSSKNQSKGKSKPANSLMGNAFAEAFAKAKK
ncbi:Tex family protein [Thalassotalea aquiviva]|uniref:Tex family protein n=1 Tax=Thalassotalea aquiviva TaxID=3242415 RepID=UPI00352ADE0A